MFKKTSASAQGPDNRDLVYGLATPFSFMDIFAYLRLNATSEEETSTSQREDMVFYSYRKWRARCS